MQTANTANPTIDCKNLSFHTFFRKDKEVIDFRIKHNVPTTYGAIPNLPMDKGKLTTDVDIKIQEKTATANRYFTGEKNPIKQNDRNMYPNSVISITLLYDQIVTYLINKPACPC
jgi:hypothetical protein